MGCRVTPLTVLFVLSGFIMIVSHRYFLVDSPTRVIVQPRRSGLRPAAFSADQDDTRTTLDALQNEGPDGFDGEGDHNAGLHDVIAHNEAHRRTRVHDESDDADADADDAEEEEEEKDGDDDEEDLDDDDDEEGEQPGGGALEAAATDGDATAAAAGGGDGGSSVSSVSSYASIA